jgi:V/A-type H+-transporting ATPase subunit E
MMAGSEKITTRILSEAQEQAREIIETARQQADVSFERALGDARENAKSIMERAKRDAAENENRIMAVADLSLRKALLSAKQEVLGEAFSQAVQAFVDMDDARFRELYTELLLGVIDNGNEGIAPAKADAGRIDETFVQDLNTALVKKGLPGQVTMLPARADIAGGAVVVRGEMEIDLSVKSILQSVRERNEGEVAAMLFAFLEE